MSVLLSTDDGWVISHSEFIKNVYKNVIDNGNIRDYRLKNDLFKINGPFLRYNEDINKYYKPNLKKRRKCENDYNKFRELKLVASKVENLYNTILQDGHIKNIFCNDLSIEEKNNKEAQKLAESCYNQMNQNTLNISGVNNDRNSVRKVNDEDYLFPEQSRFFCKNISEIAIGLKHEVFDLILLDPPWWNKFIRRKRGRSNSGYDMLHNIDLKIIPIETLLNKNGLVVVWCTNSPQHQSDLYNEVFPAWNLKKIATWYWIKVTNSGETICKFNEPPGKQPFEQIVIANHKDDPVIDFPDQKVIVSVPSSINSHKPPLNDLFKPFIVENGKCLEIFARYLLPGWTSWGFEAIKLQHKCLYE